MFKTVAREGVCPSHARRHRLLVGLVNGEKVAQCPGDQKEWDVSQVSRSRVIVDIDSGRHVTMPLEIQD